MHRILAAAGLNPGPYMGQYTVVDRSDQCVVRVDHNPNILAMHSEAVVPNKRAAAMVVGRRVRNSAVVGFREDPNRWGGGFGPIPCGEAVLAGDLSACDGYVLRCNCVAADHRVENLWIAAVRRFPAG